MIVRRFNIKCVTIKKSKKRYAIGHLLKWKTDHSGFRLILEVYCAVEFLNHPMNEQSRYSLIYEEFFDNFWR
jgi:hypothetical protein